MINVQEFNFAYFFGCASLSVEEYMSCYKPYEAQTGKRTLYNGFQISQNERQDS